MSPRELTLALGSGLAALLLAAAPAAQPPAPGALDLSDFDPAYIRQALTPNIRRAHSFDSLEEIPSPLVYRAVFRALQGEAARDRRFSAEDLALIQDLPSHWTRRFQEPALEAREALCLELLLGSNGEGLDVVALASLCQAGQQASRRRLEAHYEQVLSSLSEPAREAVEERIEALEGTGQMAYATVDLKGLSESAPDIALQVLSNGCTNLMEAQASRFPQEQLLGETPALLIPMDGEPSP